MRISERIAREHGAKCLVTGENLGQVASQTMESLCATDSVVSCPVFRPLIGMDKEEIVEISKHIGTYETSILPFEDCCTIFVPKHPKTKPSLSELEEAENLIPEIWDMLDAAVENEEVVIAGKSQKSEQ